MPYLQDTSKYTPFHLLLTFILVWDFIILYILFEFFSNYISISL